MTMTETSCEAFDAKYQPIDHMTLGSDTPDHCEHWHLDGVSHRHVWTVIEDDNGGLHAVHGFRYVNRVYHVVTREPWDEQSLDYVLLDPSEVTA